MLKQVEELMSASLSDENTDEAIRMCQQELDRVKRQIERLVDSVADDIDEQERTTTRKFEDIIFDKLNTLVTGKSSDFDNEAMTTINNTASLLMNSYKNGIQAAICEKARNQSESEKEDGISLESLKNMNL